MPPAELLLFGREGRARVGTLPAHVAGADGYPGWRQATQLLSTRHGLLAEQALAVLQGLAESQGRGLQEFAAAVVRSGGRLDG